MNAYEILNQRFTGVAGAAVARRRFVTVDSNGHFIQTTAGLRAVGASLSSAGSGESFDVGDGIVIVEAGEAVAAGNAVESDATGRAIVLNAVTTDATAGGANTPVPETARNGVALTAAAAAGNYIAVKLG